MDQIQREKIAEKLKKIKALAERGEGGEKETAKRMYEALKRRYEITDTEANGVAVETADISDIDLRSLRQYRGISFAMAAVVSTLAQENEICKDCPYANNAEQCGECSTYWNIRDLQVEFETMQQRLVKAAMEV
jgi:hypothetical protein